MITKKILQSLFYQMLRIRMVEERIVELYPQQQMRCPVHLCIGQEAVAAGVSANLKNEDLVLSNHRSHGHYLAKGGNLEKLFAELYGKETGCSRGRGGSMHLIDLSVNFLGSTPIVGGTIPVATGVAWAEKMKNNKTVTVAFLGDAAVEEGAFHESVNFAVLKNLPIVFVCENNLYSVYTPIAERQPKRSIASLAKGYGIRSFRADGNDCGKVYEVSKEMIDAVRAGRGPALIEFLTYRWREHCGPNYDNHIGYRDEAEFKLWQKKCPIDRFKKYALLNKVIKPAEITGMETQIQKEIDTAVTLAQAAPFAKGVSLNDVYAL
ncbi:MAG TPA: thiamine pyrophosphate-dependent dehydrogenase E1 component subunit alpha [Candidatus Omnitrophota bacterium]|nr:thiamine pyrophosphate-dependent dehydrogenase E1 component subunit alpha [Candidatus Omnitrophota bacterium]HPD85583.1 thiamine pyrophosphate-dependent dehydrogenase E1 component subunit alpha [Candidatus Omnitrophota bacterium]HRZ04377.1 thiamine pyrophosphate-dependent dehydrogenase E1 component subunit alpha [Candidatus Omnitrophota bacterium]